MKVDIENFEIIRDAELEFIPGLNVIVGPTNNGKSSIFRALQSALFNELGDDFINNQETECSVRIKDGDNVVEWEKRENKNPTTVYKINGERYTKVGRTQFEEVADTLNISEVKLTSNDKERLNFWNQMKYPFLLDKSGSQLFEFLSLSSENENLAEVVKEMKGDLKDINKEKNKMEGGIDSLKGVINDEESYLEKKDGFSDLYDEIIDIEVDISRYETIDTKIDTVIKKREKYENIKSSYEEIDSFLDEFLYNYRDLGLKFKKYVNLKKMYGRVTDLKQERDFIKDDLDELEEDLNVVDLNTLDNSLNQYQKINQKKNDLDSLINNLKDKKEKYNDLDKLLSDIKNNLDEIDLDVMFSKIKDIESNKDKLDTVDNYLDTIEGKYQEKIKYKNKVGDIENNLKSVEEELESFDICPLCGKKQ